MDKALFRMILRWVLVRGVRGTQIPHGCHTEALTAPGQTLFTFLVYIDRLQGAKSRMQLLLLTSSSAAGQSGLEFVHNTRKLVQPCVIVSSSHMAVSRCNGTYACH